MIAPCRIPRPDAAASTRRRAWTIAAFVLVLLACVAGVRPVLAAGAAANAKMPEATLTIANRDIVTFRASLLGADPATRARRAEERFDALPEAAYEAPVKVYPASLGELRGYSVLVGDVRVFSLLPADLDPEDNLPLEQAAEQARKNVAEALGALRDQRKLPVLLNGLLHAVIAAAVFGALVWVLHKLGTVIRGWLQRRHDALASRGSPHWGEYVIDLLLRLMLLVRWVLIVVLGYGWVTYALEHFPLTQPLGHHLIRFVADLAQWLVSGLLDALPGIATIAVIAFVTRAIVDAIGRFFTGVQTGQRKVGFLHRETISATRRIVVFLAWGFAVAVAYPFIPGSGSEAFKGLSVLLGLMVSLGSTGLVNQLMSGLVVIYTRALRKGDLVVLDGVEGVVSEVGALATKVVTMRNEEITIPNSTVIAGPIRNYSKLSGSTGTMLATKVTIGYDAPWRQVHAMLELAAHRTAGLRDDPKPFVFQRALSDFYVEYELFAYTDRPLERVATLSVLHGNIQDVFNEHGVQILSPHFVLQPKQAVVVPPSGWYPEPAPPPGSEKR